MRSLENTLEPFDPPTINLRQLRMQHNAKVGSFDGRTIDDNSLPLRLEFQQTCLHGGIIKPVFDRLKDPGNLSIDLADLTFALRNRRAASLILFSRLFLKCVDEGGDQFGRQQSRLEVLRERGVQSPDA